MVTLFTHLKNQPLLETVCGIIDFFFVGVDWSPSSNIWSSGWMLGLRMRAAGALGFSGCQGLHCVLTGVESQDLLHLVLELEHGEQPHCREPLNCYLVGSRPRTDISKSCFQGRPGNW